MHRTMAEMADSNSSMCLMSIFCCAVDSPAPCSAATCTKFSQRLVEEYNAVCCCLGTKKTRYLVDGIYIHVYGKHSTITCSGFGLEKALGFFDFVPGPIDALPCSSVIDVHPFLVAKETQKAPCKLSDIHVPWDWNEDVWVDRLIGCISTTRIHPVKVFPEL